MRKANRKKTHRGILVERKQRKIKWANTNDFYCSIQEVLCEFFFPSPLFTNSLPLDCCRCAILAIIISILLFLLLIFFLSLSNLFLLLCATLDAFYWIGCCIYWKLRCHIDCPRSVTLCLGRKYFINYIFVVATFAMVWLRILCLFFFRSSVVRSLFDVSFFRSKEIDWKSLSSTSLPFYVERETKNKY